MQQKIRCCLSALGFILIFAETLRRVVADRLAHALSGLCCCCGLDSDTQTTLCSHCLAGLPRVRRACPLCGLSKESVSEGDSSDPSDQGSASVCARCLTQAPVFSLCRSAFAYSSPIDQLITDYKFNERLDIGAGLSDELGRVMETYYSVSEGSSGVNGKPSAVIATPLHPRRLRQRGFDQAQFIARRVARRLALPDLSKRVARIRHTTPQTETKTKAERQQNLRCAFEIKNRERLSGHSHVLVIDDVITTTATVSSLTTVLRDAGIAKVDVWGIARAELRSAR